MPAGQGQLRLRLLVTPLSPQLPAPLQRLLRPAINFRGQLRRFLGIGPCNRLFGTRKLPGG